VGERENNKPPETLRLRGILVQWINPMKRKSLYFSGQLLYILKSLNLWPEFPDPDKLNINTQALLIFQRLTPAYPQD
jgi:hypothetical protein